MLGIVPAFLNSNLPSKDETSKSKKTLSIYQSRRVIDDLENSLDQDNIEENSSILHIDRQVLTGVIIDVKTFDQNSKIKKQIVCRNGENSENILYSFLILEEKNGIPTKVIYRWFRKPIYQLGKHHGVKINDEEHIYQGEMSEHRKHGEGDYIVIQKLSNSTEKQIRYVGTWEYDIFVQGTAETEDGVRQITKNSHAAFKTKSKMNGKTEKNVTIRELASQLGKKKQKSNKIIPGVIVSNMSISEAPRSRKLIPIGKK